MVFLYLIGLAVESTPSFDGEVFKKVRDPARQEYGSIPLCKPSLVHISGSLPNLGS